MKEFNLTGTKRAETGKKATRELRKKGAIPCVIYGQKKDAEGKIIATDFEVSFEAIRKLVYTPEIFLVNLDLDGEKCLAVMREIQFHPVKDNILHIDFYQVEPGQAIVMNVPVKFEGHAEGVRAGGKLSLDMRKLRVKALYNNIPEVLVINVENLDLGKTIQVRALQFDNLEILNAPNAVVCAVKLTRAARGAQAKAN